MKWCLFLVLALVVLTGCTTTRLTTPASIVNFEQVTTNLYRSGQLTSSNQWQYLADIGVKKVIKLNTDTEGSDDMGTNYGIQIVKLPMPPSGLKDWWKAPKADEYWQALLEVRWSLLRNEGVLIHCTHGQDRTGLVTGGAELYILHEPKKQVWKNMLKHNYHPIFIGLDSFFWRLPDPY